ncbi:MULTISPECIES: hypothetical protein [Bacteroides]|uniref:hypothetical protein n=1 Tax=Bacteroides TaxID=816 RepID=UPI001B3B3BE5|nr:MULTISPECIES: hypothetical protein [Bacteroides]
MEEKNKNEELKQQETNEASSAARTTYSTGTGMGPDDCMSQDFFNSLNERGAISGSIYVCGWGWTLAGWSASGCGCGSGSGSIPSCLCGCCSYDLCSCINSGCGSGSGCGSSSGSDSGSGCGSSDSHTCACSCYYCGVGSGSSSGSGSGGLNDDSSIVQEARKYHNVINDANVKNFLNELRELMIAKANNSGRQEVGCHIYYNVKERRYYKGKTKYGTTVSGSDHSSIVLGSAIPSKDGVPDGCYYITSCHIHTTLSHEDSSVKRLVGPSPSDFNELNDGFEGEYRLLLDYVGHFDEVTHKYVIIGGDRDDDDMAIYVFTKSEVISKQLF